MQQKERSPILVPTATGSSAMKTPVLTQAALKAIRVIRVTTVARSLLRLLTETSFGSTQAMRTIPPSIILSHLLNLSREQTEQTVQTALTALTVLTAQTAKLLPSR